MRAFGVATAKCIVPQRYWGHVMSDPNDDGIDANRTVFRPSPLQQRGAVQPVADPVAPQPEWGKPRDEGPAPDWGAARDDASPFGDALSTPSRLRADDVPAPAAEQIVSNRLIAAAAPVLALTAGVRTGRVRIAIPDLHRQVASATAEFERMIAPDFTEEARRLATYALCVTIDDIVQNLPGIGADEAEWEKRSMAVTFLKEAAGQKEKIEEERFWQQARTLVANASQNAELIEFYHACLAAGFEGKYRGAANGARGIADEMKALFSALEHPRGLSTVHLVDRWRGEHAPLRKVGFWSYVVLAGAATAVVLMGIYIALRLSLMTSGEPAGAALAALNPDKALRLARAATPPPEAAPSDVFLRLKSFLENEVKLGLVAVEQDGSSVRVRTTIGALFQSGSDQLLPDKTGLFLAIGTAADQENGTITVEGHADGGVGSSLSFPDNVALSKARADTVAGLIRQQLSDPSRVMTKGFGDTRPIASNFTDAGKAENRRVEIVIPRTN